MPFMRRGQAWSMDLIFGVIIFMLSIGVIYGILTSRQQNDVAAYRIESETIATKLAIDPRVQVTDGNQLDPAKLLALSKTSYDQLRADLGVQNDFCIFIEDEMGNIIYLVDPSDGTKYAGVGANSPEMNFTINCSGTFRNVQCGARLPNGC